MTDAVRIRSFRPRRSALYMPGTNARALEKAKALPADCLLIDLEDAVAPQAKEAARDEVHDAVAAGGYGPREVVVRANAVDTDWGADDIAAAVDAGADAVLMPKVEHPEEVKAANALISRAGPARDIGLWVMIETPLSVLNLLEIAATADQTRLAALVVGLNDLAVAMGTTITPDRRAFETALGLTVLAARAHGLGAIDGVHNALDDEEGFRQSCESGRLLGFDGKTLLHPRQIATANEIFAPHADDIAHARAVIAAFSRPENEDKGVIALDGRMVERLHLHEAERLVAVAEAIANRA